MPDKTRVLGGVSDGTRDTDAATVGQLNRKADEVYSDVSGRIAGKHLRRVTILIRLLQRTGRILSGTRWP